MLVSGLKNESLSEKTFVDNQDYSHVHDRLYACVQDMLVKYEENQAIGTKLTIKSRATIKLLLALEVPKGQRETISSALKLHAEALQGYEHLLSTKGNTYELVKQTQWLREGPDDAPASLIRYHELKNKFLGVDTLLDAEQQKAVSELDKKKSLTLQMLETIDAHPDTTARALARLHKADLLKPNLCALVLENKNPDNAAEVIVELVSRGNIKASVAEIARHFSLEAQGFELLYELLTREMADDIQVFCTALNNGHMDAISAFIEKGKVVITALPMLSDGQKAALLSRLLAGKSDGSKPGFYMLREKSNTEIISLFIKASVTAINSFSPSITERTQILFDLLASKAVDGTPHFFMALKKGRPDIVTSYIHESVSAIDTLPLSPLAAEQKAELLCVLLASKTTDGMPVFFMALQNNHPETITAFIQAGTQAITALSGSEEKSAELIYRLFHSMEIDNKENFLLSLKQGGPAVNKAFTEAIDRLPLSPEQKETLTFYTQFR